MKFEGNIPSYLRTGAGSFAVSDKKLANVKKTENLQSMQVPTMGKDEQDTQDQTDIFIG